MKSITKHKTFIFRTLYYLLLGYIIVTTFLILYQNQSNFLTFNYWQTFAEQKKTFYDSQYKNPHPQGFIPDNLAYSYTGGALIKGENPVFNIPEAPPLGKYLIGLSAIIFNNANIIIVLMTGIAALVMLYLLSRQILGKSFVSLFPAAIIVSEPLYRNQYKVVPLFDFAQLFFVVTSFYFFNKGLTEKKKPLLFFALASLFIGLFISTKFYSSGLPIIAAMMLVLLLHRYWKKLILFVSTLWVPIFILLATYIRVFAFGYDLREFLGIQKWIFWYWQGALILPFTAWDLLLFNKWHTWWGNHAIISDAQWNILWPIAASLSLVTLVLYLTRRIKHKLELEVLLAFVVFYGAFISLGTPTVRYFIIYLPFLYIITLYLIKELLKRLVAKVPNKTRHPAEKNNIPK